MESVHTAAAGEQPQHLTALQRANEVRLARADLKRRVASGDVAVQAVINRPPPEAENMELMDLLMSQRRWGRTRTLKLLASVPLREDKLLATLTQRQRGMLCALLPQCRTQAHAAALAAA